MKQKIVYLGLPVIGMMFCLWYIKIATVDVVYTDYIRLVNTYLPDVWNPAKFFVPDLLTRIPIYYLARGINASFFGFSTTFDMVLGVFGLGLSGLVLGWYCKERKLSLFWYVLIMLTVFCLNKWEMLTNGSGWAHFLAFAGFYYHYLVFDRTITKQEKKHDRIRLFLLPFLLTILIAGPYCAVYTVTMLMFYGYGLVKTKDVRAWLTAVCGVLLPFFLYLWSNSFAVTNHAGAVNISFGEAFAASPGFFPRFLLKALASSVVGVETLDKWVEAGMITNRQIYLLGGVAAAGYLLAILAVILFKLYEKTVFPCMLMLSGIGNYGIVLISRYIFQNENYGMSSRYALQYQMGILGILLTFALLWKQLSPVIIKIAVIVFVILLTMGQFYTNLAEIRKAPKRAEYGKHIAEVALKFESVDDNVLRETFDYREIEPDSGARVREALTILKNNHWNVFR